MIYQNNDVVDNSERVQVGGQWHHMLKCNWLALLRIMHEHSLDSLSEWFTFPVNKLLSCFSDIFLQDLEKRLEDTTSRLTQERDSIKKELDELQRDLVAKLKRAEDDAKKLSNILQERDQGLGSANSHIDGLKKHNSQLKTELDSMQKELRDALNEVHSLKVRCEWLCNLQLCLVSKRFSSRDQRQFVPT